VNNLVVLIVLEEFKYLGKHINNTIRINKSFKSLQILLFKLQQKNKIVIYRYVNKNSLNMNFTHSLTIIFILF